MEPWPLTGRSALLEALGRHHRDPARAGVVLHGPAGVGKTRLAEEALGLAERSGRRVERVVGHPATREIPLGALAHLLPTDVTGSLGVGDDERTALFHAARAELRRLAGEEHDARLVLLVDDLDLLDDTSVAVLVPLVASRTVFLVGTVRTGRSPSDQFTALQRDGHLVRMEVEPLDPDEVGALLHRALDGPLTDRARAELARLSGGNLQVLTELVRGARERGALEEHDGAWDLDGPLPTTAALDDLVSEHLAGVPPEGKEVLEILAVCGRFGLADLEASHGAATLEALEADGLITAVTSDRRTAVRLAHPLYGEVLRAGLAPLRLRRIQADLADRVEAHGSRRREDILQVALWRVASGGTVETGCLLKASRLALAGHDPALAVRLLDSPTGQALGTTTRAEALVEAHAMLGDLDAVEKHVADVWDEDMTDSRRAHLANRLAEVRFYRARDLDGALAAHQAARERVTTPDAAAAVDARRASLLAGAGRPADALAILDGTDPHGTTDSPRTAVDLGAARATSLLGLGRFEEAAAEARRAAERQAELPHWAARRGIAQHLVNEAHALAYSGRYAEARALLEPAAERAKENGALRAWVWFEMALAEIARDTGRGHETVRRFTAVAAEAPGAGQEAALVWAHVGIAQGHLLLGDCTAAAAALAEADRVGDSPLATSWATRERTRAWLDACRGDLAAARRRIAELVEPMRRDHMHVFEATLLHDLVRLGDPAAAVERLDELAGVMDGPLAATRPVHARALVESDTAALHDVADRFEAIDALSLAAEAAAELADLHRAKGEARLATAAARRSAEIAERAGGLRTPGMGRGSGVEPLTDREREVALLAAAGRTSKDIGEHLGMATRTVDTHLARVYRKLGITGRSELPDALDA